MGEPLEVHIRRLQDFYWSDADPDGRAFVPLADALRKAGDLREAHRLLRDGLARHPDYLSGHVVAAWLSVDQGEPEKAETRFRRALELDPSNVAALRGLADVLLERGETDEALGVLDSLLGEDPLDQNLPGRIQEVRFQTQEPSTAESFEATDPAPIWEDSEGVEDELDWEAAALQEDSSAPEGAKEEISADEPEESGEQAPIQVVEDGEPIPSPEDVEEALVTSTLGEIYLRQGLFDRAEDVFNTLLERDPHNEHLQHRFDEARALQSSHGLTDTTREETEPAAEEEPSPPVEAFTEDSDLEDQAIAIEALAPDEILPVDALAPEDVLSIDAVAPEEVLPIDSLAPEAPEEVVGIDALAPEEVVGIDSLAPDEVVTVDALAPDSQAQALTSDDPDGTGSGDDPTIDAFERWLENLQ